MNYRLLRFPAYTIEGRISNQSPKGKFTVINFWFWPTPCPIEIID